MVQFPTCPKCTNTGLSIVDVDIQGQKLKGVLCNHCKEILWIYQDNSEKTDELKELVDILESAVDDLESELARIRKLV